MLRQKGKSAENQCSNTGNGEVDLCHCAQIAVSANGFNLEDVSALIRQMSGTKLYEIRLSVTVFLVLKAFFDLRFVKSMRIAC